MRLFIMKGTTLPAANLPRYCYTSTSQMEQGRAFPKLFTRPKAIHSPAHGNVTTAQFHGALPFLPAIIGHYTHAINGSGGSSRLSLHERADPAGLVFQHQFRSQGSHCDPNGQIQHAPGFGIGE